MSGGSLNYLYYNVEDAANKFDDVELRELCLDFSELLRALEWYLSGDTSDYSEDVKAFKKKWFKSNRSTRLESIIKKECASLQDKLMEML